MQIQFMQKRTNNDIERQTRLRYMIVIHVLVLESYHLTFIPIWRNVCHN